jgi:hypothetical protein
MDTPRSLEHSTVHTENPQWHYGSDTFHHFVDQKIRWGLDDWVDTHKSWWSNRLFPVVALLFSLVVKKQRPEKDNWELSKITTLVNKSHICFSASSFKAQNADQNSIKTKSKVSRDHGLKRIFEGAPPFRYTGTWLHVEFLWETKTNPHPCAKLAPRIFSLLIETEHRMCFRQIRISTCKH